MNGLVFYDKTHRYKLDGEWVPGVTTILNVLDKPAISKWAARVVAEYVADNRATVEGLYAAGRGPMVAMLKETPWQQMRTAGERGTSFHDFAERISNGEEVDVPEPMVPLVENALRFMDDWRIEPVLVEAAVGSREHRYAGKLDLAATYRNPVTHEEGVGIFDWKSGKRIYAGAAFQMNAYGHAEFHGQRGDEHPLPAITAAFGVHIREDDYDVHELPYGPTVFEEFLTIRKVYDINKRAEGNWREAGSGYVGAAIRDQEIAS
jgi:hypothetical protein